MGLLNLKLALGPSELDAFFQGDYFDKLRERDLREFERKSEDAEYVSFEIHQEDTVVMKSMKKCLNSRKMLRQDFYDYFGPEKGYGVFYAIQTRHDLYGDILNKIMEFANIEMAVTFR